MFIIALATCVVLLVLGREDLGLKGILGVVALLVACAVFLSALHLHPLLFTTVLALVDIVLLLKVVGADIVVR
jgi:hypothetical protein